MKSNIPVLIVVLPLVASLLAPLFSYISRKLIRAASLLAIFASFICSASGLYYSLTEGTWHYKFGGWAPPWGIEYVIDPLAGVMTTLITFISFLAIIYAGPYLKNAGWLKRGNFHSLYLLLTAGLLGIVATGDLFNLYVFLEISSLAAYALISSGGPKATLAAFKYLLIGTIAASFYLLGIGYLYAVTGTLNMADLADKIPGVINSEATLVGIVLIVVGMGLKTALFPMHGWLPDSYSYSPPPVAAFISAVMTKVSAYVILRITFYIFDPMSAPIQDALTVIGWLAAAGIIMGSILAIAQSDFRRMLAYSSVAQIGYVIVGISIGNSYALIGAMLHIINHAIMKSCLFLVSGGIKWKTGKNRIPNLIELNRKMPLTMTALLIAALSMVGLPPTAGFFSKWYLVLGAVQAHAWPYVIVIIVSSLLNAVYFFRIIENTFLRRKSQEQLQKEASLKSKVLPELPVTMLIPIVILGAGIMVAGIFNNHIVTYILQFSLPGGGL